LLRSRAGWEQFLAFARENGAPTETKVAACHSRVWQALTEAARGQLAHQQEANPVARFLELLRTAIATGRAHLATRNGGAGLTIQGRGLAAYTRPQHDRLDGRDGCARAWVTPLLRMY
jgi:hypothetical protein